MQISFSKPLADAMTVKRNERPSEKVSSLSVFVGSPEHLVVQVRRVSDKVISIAGASLHLEEARQMRDFLEGWIRDREAYLEHEQRRPRAAAR